MDRAFIFRLKAAHPQSRINLWEGCAASSVCLGGEGGGVKLFLSLFGVAVEGCRVMTRFLSSAMWYTRSRLLKTFWKFGIVPNYNWNGQQNFPMSVLSGAVHPLTEQSRKQIRKRVGNKV